MQAHLAPRTIHQLHDPFSQKQVLLQGPKREHVSDLKANQVCLDRCNIDVLSNENLNAQETTCMKQCFVKYFDASLLVENEWVNYTRGLPM